MVKRRHRSKIGTAPKAVARAFKSIAQGAASDPSILVPKCTKECRRCPWRAIEEKMARISGFKGEKRRLLRASKWGDPLLRGYASLLLLTDEEIPYIANASVEGRLVSYVLRGSAPKDVMIGLLNPEDPGVRLLAYRSSAARKGVTVCSTTKGLYCIGREGAIPPELLSEVLSETPYSFSPSPSGARCAHKGGSRLLALDMRGTRIELCSRCASREHSLPSFIKRRMTDVRHLSISTMLDMDCASNCTPCPVKRFEPLGGPSGARYLTGRASDADALSSAIDERIAGIKERVIILGERCCGSDVECAVRELGLEGAEAKALRAALSGYQRPLLIDSPSFGRVMAALWEERGLEALRALTSEQKARRLIHEKGHPAEILRKVVEEERAAQVLSRLPEYHALGPGAQLVDAVARTYKVKGAKAACEEIEHHPRQEASTRALAFAMLRALGAEGSRAWQYSMEEQQLGIALAPLATDMLSAEGDGYDQALRSLLRLSGTEEEPRR